MIGTQSNEIPYSIDKLPEIHSLIDVEARGVFSMGFLDVSLKLLDGLRMHVLRDKVVNE